jgi:hypothetical protein
MKYKNWLIVILISVAVVIALLVSSILNRPKFDEAGNLISGQADVLVTPDKDKYTELAQEMVNEFYQNTDAQKTRENLLTLRVPAEWQNFHVNLVFAFEENRSIESIKADLESFAAEVEWLSIPK